MEKYPTTTEQEKIRMNKKIEDELPGTHQDRKTEPRK